MTLDEGYLNQAELLARDRERDRAARKAEADLQAWVESVEAEEARWHHPTQGIFAQSAREIPEVHYDDGPDWRLFG